MSAISWFFSGMLGGVVVTILTAFAWRALQRGRAPTPRRLLLGGAAALSLFTVSAVIMYLAVVSPGGSHAPVTPPHAGAATGQAESMEAATAKLAARLERNGGSPEDWSLLAKSYEFLGRAEDAARAHARAAGVTPDATRPGDRAMPAAAIPQEIPATRTPEELAPRSVEELESHLKSSPRDALAWLALASLRHTQHDYIKARNAYQKAIGLYAMTSQAWADYADTLGSLSGGNIGADAAKAIERSLKLDPANVQAGWLEATRSYQQHRYVQALSEWKHLRSLLPPDSPDLQVVDANITQASQLAGEPASAPLETPAESSLPLSLAAELDSSGGSGAADVSGTVTLDQRLAARVGTNSTLFIYAKAVDSPGPPLAVLRTTTATWPVNFHLDDSMAMVPSRRLSQFKKVLIEARISRSGQATPAPGDLYATSDVLSPGTGRKLALVINHEIG